MSIREQMYPLLLLLVRGEYITMRQHSELITLAKKFEELHLTMKQQVE